MGRTNKSQRGAKSITIKAKQNEFLQRNQDEQEIVITKGHDFIFLYGGQITN